jgi:hypothetical protein
VNKREARSLISRVIKDMYDAANCVTELYEGQAWLVLGYADWSELCAAEFGSLRELGQTERRTLVSSMSAHGMSTRAQGAVTGTSAPTIMRDQQQVLQDETPGNVVGLDGKTYTRRARPEPEPEPEPEQLTPRQLAEAWCQQNVGAQPWDAYLAGWYEHDNRRSKIT